MIGLHCQQLIFGGCMSDEELAVLALSNLLHFDALVNRYRLPLSNFIMKRFYLNKEETEDVVQEAFMKAFLNLKTFDSTKKWKTWLYQIAIYAACNSFRTPRSESLDNYTAFLMIVAESPEERLDRNLRREMVQKILKALDATYRKVLELYYVSGLSNEQIAEKLNLNALAVKSKIKYAERAILLALPTKAVEL